MQQGLTLLPITRRRQYLLSVYLKHLSSFGLTPATRLLVKKS
jgi:hypothetical protein